MCNVASGKLIAKLMCKGNLEKDEGTEQEEIGTAFVLCSLHTREGRLGRKASRRQAARSGRNQGETAEAAWWKRSPKFLSDHCQNDSQN